MKMSRNSHYFNAVSKFRLNLAYMKEIEHSLKSTETES